MTGPPPVDDGVLRRHFVAVATGTYADGKYQNLPVAGEVEQLAAWLGDGSTLGDRGFAPAFPDLAHDPDEEQIRDAFRTPVKRWTARDAAVVFVTGHGEVADGSHWLVLSDSEHDDLPNTAVRTGDLIRWLKRPDGIEHLLLVIDACFAGGLLADTVRFDDELPASWLILPSASRDGTATAGAMTAAMTAAVAKLRGGQGEKYGRNGRYFRVGDFIDTLREFLPGQQVDPLYRGAFNAEHVCLPNPHYAAPDVVPTQSRRHDLALPKSDLGTHWAPRARGTDTDDRWLFTGRADLVRALIAAVDPAQPVGPPVVVAGGAGCGKSAVLARLVTLSDPDFVTTYAGQVADIPADLRPPVGAVDVAVLATAKYTHEVLAQISDAIGAAPPERGGGAADLEPGITACRATLDRRWADGVGTTVVLDALDEATEPIGIARMLARLRDNPGLRLLVGVRSPAGAGDPLAAHGPAGTLADQVELVLGARRMQVDDDTWWRQDDVRDYAAGILRYTPRSPYRDGDGHRVAAVAAAVIAQRVGRSFLVARLAATALTQHPEPVDPADPVWLASLDDGVVGAFRADLFRLFPEPDRRLAAVELLRAVAFAYGHGLPWGEIWPLTANAVADRHGKYGDRDIADLLAAPISAYLTTDEEDGTTVYRLFHDALRATLRDRWTELLTAPAPA